MKNKASRFIILLLPGYRFRQHERDRTAMVVSRIREPKKFDKPFF